MKNLKAAAKLKMDEALALALSSGPRFPSTTEACAAAWAVYDAAFLAHDAADQSQLNAFAKKMTKRAPRWTEY